MYALKCRENALVIRSGSEVEGLRRSDYKAGDGGGAVV